MEDTGHHRFGRTVISWTVYGSCMQEHDWEWRVYVWNGHSTNTQHIFHRREHAEAFIHELLRICAVMVLEQAEVYFSAAGLNDIRYKLDLD